jgi:hypothetical protein
MRDPGGARSWPATVVDGAAESTPQDVHLDDPHGCLLDYGAKHSVVNVNRTKMYSTSLVVSLTMHFGISGA